ncbi:MAG TPA: glutathione-disulfide reductase, partial [Rhizobiales bacterium]|nr:glutathione-disulfide reductase [Hyphomicrobiales bacterium]
DLFVIGAGSGGVRAARIAAGYGAKVAVAEEYRVGGTCVIRGCVPKKLFVYASHFSEDFTNAQGFGWQVRSATFDWQTLLARKDAEIDRLNKIYIDNLKAAGVEIIDSRAEFEDAHSVRLVHTGTVVTAKNILAAPGATPSVPLNVPGASFAITSNEAFHLKELPDSIAIIGGGYIAVEFAGIFNGLGVKTHLLYRGDPVLRGFDEDLRLGVQAEMIKKGIDVRCHANVIGIEEKNGGFSVDIQDRDRLDVDLVMYATGRTPNTQGLCLEKAGVLLDGAGAIIVDEYSRTNVDHIYAVGDVTNRAQLTPVAIREGHAFADTVFGGRDVKVDHSLIPTAIFTQPEIGTVGLAEEEARARHGDVDIYKSTFRPMKHTLSGSDEKMMMKLIVDAKTDKVLGCHVMGEGAGEMSQLLGIPLKMGATKADFDATMAVHPTAAEELVTMRTKWQG